ncbi:MAG: GntG family PLP-dependent aldolase [Candidatus Limnocylindrales bacterium]
MSDHLIDLRSDTVSRPTDAMRAAMAAAPVGDDVFGDDPTVIALEERAAELLGKEAGLFVPSGTMGNLVAMIAHLGRGTEVIAGATHHLVVDEQAGHAVIVGASARTLADRPDGTLDLEAIEDAFRGPRRRPRAALRADRPGEHPRPLHGPAPDPAYTRAVAAIARRHGVPLHLDGARFWNAVVAQRAASVTARDLADPADTVTFCLSKGLGCPVGSVVVGRREVIARARRGRKLVGGGMRQAGIIAAAGLLALRDGPEGMIDRLADDHANARRLAEALSEMAGVASPGGVAQPAPGRLDPGRVATNFVLFKVDRDRAAFLAALRARNVLMVEYAHGQVRAVTHHGVTADDIDTTIAATRAALADTASAGRGVTPAAAAV